MKKWLVILMILNGLILQAQDEVLVQTSQEFQDQLNRDYADKAKSPLTDGDFKTFKSLDFFPINEKFIVEAQFIRTKREKVFEMKTSTARLPQYKKYGELHFKIDGVNYKLNVYQSMDLIKMAKYKNHLFLPFSDTTCGKESYIGGRHIDM